VSGERVVRNKSTTTASLVMGILALLAAVVSIRYAVAHSPGSSKTLENQWALGVFLLLLAALGILFSRTRVVVTPGSPTFVVKNTFRSHEIAWSDVEGFTDRLSMTGGPGGRTVIVKVRLKNGRSIRCSGLSGPGMSTDPYDLERELDSMRREQMVKGTGATTSERL
jgi:hypothetical protein